ncbi:MAG: amidohydrolase family protein, partial [Promethearchaeota archaeon]
MSRPILFYNGKIWTPQGNMSWMLIEGNLIKDIGNKNPPVLNAERINLQGKSILPGLMDAHIHVFGTGRARYDLQLNKPRSITKLQEKLKTYVEQSEDKEGWIVGRNWDQEYMEEKRYPTRYDL